MELSLRLTHKYVGTYQHQDKWQRIGVIDEIGTRDHKPPREQDEDSDYSDQDYDFCESRSQEVFVLVKIDEDEKPEEQQIIAALHDTYTSQGCHCEHDCCGCRSYYATDVTRVTGDLFKVIVASSRNY